MRISECETGDGESLPKPLPRRPKARTTSPAAKNHDAVVAAVRDEDVARPVHRHAVQALSLARAAASPKVRTPSPAADKTTMRWLPQSAT